MINLRLKENIVKFFPFASVARVLTGFQEDEIIIDFNVGKPMKISLQYVQQRNFLMEVMKLAAGTGKEHSKKDKVNDPHNINFSNSSIGSRQSSINPLSFLIEYSLFIILAKSN